MYLLFGVMSATEFGEVTIDECLSSRENYGIMYYSADACGFHASAFDMVIVCTLYYVEPLSIPCYPLYSYQRTYYEPRAEPLVHPAESAGRQDHSVPYALLCPIIGLAHGVWTVGSSLSVPFRLLSV